MTNPAWAWRVPTTMTKTGEVRLGPLLLAWDFGYELGPRSVWSMVELQVMKGPVRVAALLRVKHPRRGA